MTIIIPTGLAFVIGIALSIFIFKYYQNIRLFVADVIAACSFVCKRLKKFSVINEIEGSINIIADQLNKEMPEQVLPRCKIKWVKPEDQKSIVQGNEAIICLSFDKKDREQNAYNAIFSFIQTGLINRAKPFLQKETSKAIDLLTTKVILQKNRPRILQKFNEHFSQEPIECKEKFYKIETIDENGIFHSLFIPELKTFGDNVFTKTPNYKIEQEAERFLDWLHKLIMRESGEDSILHFEGSYFKVGTILVADSEVYDQHGINAYVRRAYLYADKGYPCIYLISSGNIKSSITHKIAQTMTCNEHFTKLNKQTDIVRYDEVGEKYLITCIGLKINHDIIKYDFWGHIKESKKNDNTLKGEIFYVKEDRVLINYLGKTHDVLRNDLSRIEINDLCQYFKPHDLLSLKVMDFDENDGLVHFSNKDTDTDPAKSIEDNLSAKKIFSVKKIMKNKMGYEVGLLVHNSEENISGFVPRSLATNNRFDVLSDRYSVGQTLEIEIQKYDPERGNYVCKVCNLIDPWDNIPSSSITNFKVVEAEIKEILHSYITCLVAEGLEGRIEINNLSWSSIENNRVKIKNFKIGQTVKAKILSIDRSRKLVDLSMKVLQGSPVIEFFENHVSSIVTSKVTEITQNGIKVSISSNVDGFIYKSEMSWFYIQNHEGIYSIGDNINIRIINYNEKHQNLICSIKSAQQNDFEALSSKIQEGSVVYGEVLRNFENKAEVRIEKDGLHSYGFVHKSEFSNILFVTEDLYSQILVPGESYHFVVVKINHSFMTFTLSRKSYYEQMIGSVKYGNEYDVKVVPTPEKVYVFSEGFEGCLVGDVPDSLSQVKALPSRINGYDVEMYVIHDSCRSL